VKIKKKLLAEHGRRALAKPLPQRGHLKMPNRPVMGKKRLMRAKPGHPFLAPRTSLSRARQAQLAERRGSKNERKKSKIAEMVLKKEKTKGVRKVTTQRRRVKNKNDAQSLTGLFKGSSWQKRGPKKTIQTARNSANVSRPRPAGPTSGLTFRRHANIVEGHRKRTQTFRLQ